MTKEEKILFLKDMLKEALKETTRWTDLLSLPRYSYNDDYVIENLISANAFPLFNKLETGTILSDDEYSNIKVWYLAENEYSDLGVIEYEGVSVMFFSLSKGEYNVYILDKYNYIQTIIYIQQVRMMRESHTIPVIESDIDPRPLIDFYDSHFGGI